MAENRRERGQGSYYFSRGQLAILAFGFTVTCSIVFFLGMLVGQGIEERKLQRSGDEGPVPKIPLLASSEKSSTATGPASEQEMTFYDTLTKNPPADQTGAPAKTPEVQSEKEPVKTAKVREPPRRSREAPAKSSQPRAKMSAKKNATIWAVQVKAFTRGGDAQVLASKLKGKGYDAYVVSTTIRGKTWHRVRVGRLSTRTEARSLLERLKTREKFTGAIITKEAS